MQRAAVQWRVCVTYGQKSSKMVADHKTPLLLEYLKRGRIDTVKMRKMKAIQPQWSRCSSQQGAFLSQLSRKINKMRGW